MSAQITNPSAFEEGSLGIQVALFIVTFGLYGIFWMYKAASQLDSGTDADLSPILVIVPIYGMWMLAEGAEAVADQSQLVIFLLFLFVSPAGWFLTQSGINGTASGG
ncbi:DUF4234 domain-containing protein [Halomicroarcula sp. GCM10025709]|uniref:DUF4234 domain-containing protein n=1 Tax=Haloarcula TaxID=2237 RepID=UPI0024C364E3|nr:DUF4234 domain-containing protein [Halomicroarcula sp. YJ-61-S]